MYTYTEGCHAGWPTRQSRRQARGAPLGAEPAQRAGPKPETSISITITFTFKGVPEAPPARRAGASRGTPPNPTFRDCTTYCVTAFTVFTVLLLY